MKVTREATLSLKIAGGLLAIAMLGGCGSSMSSMTGTTQLNSASVSAATSGANAECNTFNAQGAVLSGLITDYYYNGALQNDRVRVRINTIDNQFTLNANTYIQFYRWKTDSSGNGVLDSTPLTFQIEAGNSAQSPFASGMTSLSASDIVNIAPSGGLSVTTAQQFFSSVTIVPIGLDQSWTAIKTVLYNGVQPIAQVDSLLPMFTANPNEYATTHPSVLNQLHPFWNSRTQTSLSDAAWVSLSNSYCF